MPDVRESRSIVIVGNGPVGDGLAALIDAADLVIRFNDCRSYGPGGRKTDIVAVCNTGRPALSMLSGADWMASEPVRRANEIWCTRDGRHFEALRAGLSLTHPDLDDFCDDYADGFRVFAAMTGRSFLALSAAVHVAMDQALTDFAPEPYVVPSSGLLVIAHVLESVAQPRDRVFLAGFGHTGWDGHPFATERRYIDALISKGCLARLSPTSVSVFAQGA